MKLSIRRDGELTEVSKDEIEAKQACQAGSVNDRDFRPAIMGLRAQETGMTEAAIALDSNEAPGMTVPRASNAQDIRKVQVLWHKMMKLSMTLLTKSRS